MAGTGIRHAEAAGTARHSDLQGKCRLCGNQSPVEKKYQQEPDTQADQGSETRRSEMGRFAP
jgi:hypothetical protein